MADEISEEELNALLSSVGNGSQSPTSSQSFARTPMAYDFRRPQQVNKEQIRLIENIHEQFSRRFSATLASSMRMVVDVDLAFIDQAVYGEFIISLSHPCSVYSFVMDPPGGSGVLCFAPELLMAIVDRAFGGRGEGFIGEPRSLTQIEINIVNKLAGRIFRNLEEIWEIAIPAQISEIVLETNPEFIQIAGSGDPVVIIAFEVHSNSASGLVHLCYPLTTLDPLLPLLAPQHQRRGRRPTAEDDPSRSRALDKMKVPVAVQLARGTLLLRELADLRKGDVIKLDTTKDQPAVVFLGNQPKFLGRPGLDGKKRAVKIIEPIDQAAEELFR